MKARIILLDGVVVEVEGAAQEIADLTEALRQSHQVESPDDPGHDDLSIPMDLPESEPEDALPSGRLSDGSDLGDSDEAESHEDLSEDGPGDEPDEAVDLLEVAVSASGGSLGESGPPLGLVVREVAAQFRLLADPTRLQILSLLTDRGHNVGELCEFLGGQSQPAVSHHLALLRVSGLVIPSREGKFQYYDLTDQGRTLTQAVGRFAAVDESGAVQMFRQAADPTRLQILVGLSDRERNVSELCADLGGMSQPAVSHHLAKLRYSGLIEARRSGKFSYYSLRDGGRELTQMIAPMMGAKVRAGCIPAGEAFEIEAIDFSSISDDWMRDVSSSEEGPVGGDLAAADEAPSSHMLCRRVLMMAQKLHRRGYEKLRVAPGLSPSGLYWRCSIVPVGLVRRDHGAMAIDDGEIAARYGSGQGAEYFGWKDAEHDPPAAMADKFVERFPDLAAQGRGSDPEYVHWYAGMMRATAPHGLIYAYADWDLPDDHLPVLGCTADVRVPMPPAGEADLGG